MARFSFAGGLVGFLVSLSLIIPNNPEQHPFALRTVASALEGGEREVTFAWSPDLWAPYLAHLLGISKDLAVTWAGAGVQSMLVGRGGAAGTTPMLAGGGGESPPLCEHYRVCILMNNPVDSNLVAPTGGGGGGNGRDNPGFFFGTDEKLADTLFFLGSALSALRRFNVPFFDLWPFVAPGMGVGVKPASEACKTAALLLLGVLYRAGFRFFVVATGVGWTMLLKTLDKAHYAVVACDTASGEKVEVLVFVKPLYKPLFFIKCAHFCTWHQERASIVASLACAFELAGQPLADKDIEALLK